MVRREFLKSKWDPVFDSKPTSDIPRMKFSKTFSKEFFKQRSLRTGNFVGNHNGVRYLVCQQEKIYNPVGTCM